MTEPVCPIRCRNLWKVYGPGASSLRDADPAVLVAATAENAGLLAALHDVSLDIAKGEVFVIMGLSGSGKSTLVRCMTGLIEPTSGTMQIAGENLRDATPDQLIELRRHKMSMVFQDFALLPHLTVLDNIVFPLRVQGLPRAKREARAAELVELVGLSGRERHFPRELSGGQQQRVGIARSLITKPDIWFLDEPFSALDPLIRHEMQTELLRLQAALHKTVVFITHDFDEAIRIADRIAIMRSGKVVQVDTPEGLVLRPTDDYVAAFTSKIPRHLVLRASAVMGPVVAEATGEPLPATALVAEVAARVLAAGAPVPLADDQGRIIGALDRQAVIATVFGGRG
jgi:glycine betaine/proline transport system ATP-binding protein